MKKKSFLILALSMLGAVVFSSCNKDDDSDQDTLKTQIQGKWITLSWGAVETLTNDKAVYTFNADGTQTLTTSIQSAQYGHWWVNAQPATYSVTGSTITVKSSLGTNTWKDCKVSDDKLYIGTMSSVLSDNTSNSAKNLVLSRVPDNDFSSVIIGMWEGTSMTGEQTYGSEEHRFEYHKDGTYIYYTKNADGESVPDPTDSDNEYHIDGNFIYTRWKKSGTLCYEMWEITTCNDSEMEWTALREKTDGTRYTTTFKLKRIAQ